MAQLDKDNVMIRYLLGEASERERAELEGKYFDDDEYFELLLCAEEELIDAYARGEMTARERERFESHFLTTPERCQRVEFARGLRKAVSKAAPAPAPKNVKPEVTSSWWQSLLDFLRAQNLGVRVATTAAAAAVVLGGSWWLVNSWRQQRERDRASVRQPERPSPPGEQRAGNDQPTNAPQRDRPESELAQGQSARNEMQNSNRPPRAEGEARKPPPRLSVASFVLSPGLVRDTGGSNTLIIRPGTNSVRLQLDLEAEGYQSYRAALQTVDGQEVWGRGGLRASSTKSGKSVVVRVPANLLPQRDYILTLRGATAEGNVEDVAEYSFRIVKK